MDEVWEELYKIVGEVVSKAAYVEQRMNRIIARHYLGDESGALVEEVFEQERFSFDAKREIMCGLFEKHYPGHEFPDGKLRQLQKLRNIFAHGSIVSQYSDPANPDEDSKIAMLRHGATNKPIIELSTQFKTLYTEIVAAFDVLPNGGEEQKIEITAIG
jgi:hypothetical protein